MSDNECASPRAKIRHWLFKASHSVPAETNQIQALYSRRGDGVSPQWSNPSRSSYASQSTRIQATKNHALDHGGHYGDFSLADHKKDARKSQRVDRHDTEEVDARSRSQECGIRERLDFRGPFPAFGHGDGPSIETSRPRKRQRRGLSPSSDLQPAFVAETEGTPKAKDDVNAAQHAKAFRLMAVARSSASIAEDSNHSEMVFSSPKRLVKSYERRPRHKTREDRYKIKNDTMRRTKKLVRSSKDNRATDKRRHGKKLGGALMKEFTAPNVSNDRLTLKPRNGSGLFSRGKASSPIKRRALPDLAFSELAFLNTSRHESKRGTNHEDERRTKKDKKAVDTEAEISRYFIASKTKKQDNRENMRNNRCPNKQQRSKFHDSSPTIVDLPDKPFLEFGTSGANPLSPLMIVRELDARCVPTMSQRDTGSPSRSSSYLSWSQTGAPLSVSRIKKRPHTKPSESKSEPKSAEKVNLSSNNLLLGDEAEEATQAAAIPRPSEIDAAAAGVLSGQNCSPRQHTTMDQVELHNAKEAQIAHASQSPHPADLLRTNASSTAIAMISAPETSGKFAVKADSEKKAVNTVTRPLAQPSTIHKAYDSLQNTINALLQTYKAELSDSTAKDDNAGPQSKNVEVTSTTSAQFDQVKHVQGHTAPNRSDPSQMKNIDGSRTASHWSDQGRRDVSSTRFRRGNHSWETLPASRNDEPSDGRGLTYSPRAMGVPHPQFPRTSKPTIDAQNPMTGYNFLCERQPEGSTFVARESEDYTLEKGKIVPESNEYDLYQLFTGGLVNIDGYGYHEDPRCKPPQDRFDIAMENEAAGHEQSCLEYGNTNHQAAFDHSFDAQAELPAECHSHIIDPTTNYTSLYDAFLPQTLEAAQRHRFREIDRPQYSSIHPELAENPGNSSVANTPPPTLARRNHVHRVNEDSGVRLEDFWKPNKLY